MAVPPRPTQDQRFADPRAAQLAGLIEPTVTAHGLHLEEITLKPSGARTVLRVVVDYLTGTEQVDLDTIAGLSEALHVVLDKHDEAPPLGALNSYDLEVSTPGATRPLGEPRHFERNVGRLLEIDLRADAGRAKGSGALTARLKETGQDGVVVQEIKPPPKKGMKPTIGPDTHIPYTDIARARVQVEFS